MKKIRAFSLVLSSLLLFSTSASYPADSAVDLKNDGAMAVSVPLGIDNGVTRKSDFEVVVSDNAMVPIYPVELYGDRFWSQPLAEEEYRRIREGMPVRPSTLSDEERTRARIEGEKRISEFQALREEAHREGARRDINELRKKKAELEDQRDAVDDRIAAAEKDLVNEEDRAERLISSEDRDIDRAFEKLLDLADLRDELQERRLALSGERPTPREEIDRLTGQIRRLNNQIESERGSIRISRDRKRSARYAFIVRRKEWKELVAERNRLDANIRSVDRKLQDLVDSLR